MCREIATMHWWGWGADSSYKKYKFECYGKVNFKHS